MANSSSLLPPSPSTSKQILLTLQLARFFHRRKCKSMRLTQIPTIFLHRSLFAGIIPSFFFFSLISIFPLVFFLLLFLCETNASEGEPQRERDREKP